MSLTIAPSSVARRALLIAGAAAFVSSAAAEPLTSSDIVELAGGGDTLWLATSSGLNYAYDTTDTVPQWWARKTDRVPWALAFADRQALACTDVTSDVNVSRQWAVLYDHADDSLRTIGLTWKHENYRGFAGAEDLQPSFVCYAAAGAAGAWWMACLDGGLVRWNGDAATIAVPGVADSMFAIEGYPQPQLEERFTEDDARPVGLAVTDDSAGAVLVVSTPARLWRFSEYDTSWESLETTLADDRLTLIEFGDVGVNRGAVSDSIFATAAVQTATGDTAVYLFGYVNDRWIEVFGSGNGEGAPRGFSFASGRHLYVVHKAGLHLLDIADPGAPIEIGTRNLFQDRMEKATDEVAWDVITLNDVHAAGQSDSTVTLWIATSEGLFYARDERPSEPSTAPFAFTNRPLVVDGGVDNIRAYPTILNAKAPNGRVKFAYRLTKKARVTIRVYDWNMDLVKTVIDDERAAAPEGHTSARAGEDYWDGRNEAGRIVAPGVYYYRITTDQGGRAFGKIIVALKR